MPYKLKLIDNKKAYVVAKDGQKLSKKPLPVARAKKQLIAVNIAHARKMGYIEPKSQK
jgi:hypothetical protein